MVAAVLVGLLPAGTAGAVGVPAVGVPAKQDTVRTVTLVTGDRVTAWLGASPDEIRGISVERGPGRTGITFLTRRVAGHLRVLPSDAVAPLSAGRLDPRLFEVDTLLRYGYDDRRADLPLIVTAAGGAATTTARARVAGAGGTVVRELPRIGAVAVHQNRSRAAKIWQGLTQGDASARTLRADIPKVWLDGRRRPALDTSVPQIGAPAAWQAGYTGAGVTVAVLDTGIDASHPDLAGRVAGQRNFTEGVEDDRDIVGHGTHVASTIAGSGAASDGRYQGVAPGVKLLDGKICVEYGCEDSWILAGMEWAAADQRAKVVNMSLGGFDAPGLDPVEQAVQTLTEQYGTLFVVSAGNDGADGTVESPASADAALAVGAVDDSDALAGRSSRGPRVGDDAVKPDITGPGVDITAARGKDAVDVPGAPGDAYTTISGTSMAAPHVSGAAAILAQRHPDWTAGQLKAALMAAARYNPATGVYGQGAGRVDAARAVDQTVTVDPPSVSFGRQVWPHADDPVLTRTVKYHNYGSADVSLSLALNATGPDGKAAPTGTFTASATSLTVPAGGDASLTLTADTRVAGPDGYLGGDLLATGAGGVSVSTPLAINKEVESYDLTVTTLDRSGAVPGRYLTVVLDKDKEFVEREVVDASGTATLRLPKGRYVVFTFLIGGTGEKPETTLLVQPQVDLVSAQAVTMDGRLGQPLSVTVPRQGAAERLADVGFATKWGRYTMMVDIVGDQFAGMYSAQVGPDRSVDDFASTVASQWLRADASGDITDSPYAYSLAWFTTGRMVAGFTRHVAERDLASVRAEYAVQATGAVAGKGAFADGPGLAAASTSLVMPFRPPFTRTEYYNVDSAARWQSLIDEMAPDRDNPEYLGYTIGPWTSYRPGRQYRETWNTGVFAPCLPPPWEGGSPFVSRTGDTLTAFVPPYCDGQGREGNGTTTSGRTTLWRDGTKVGEESGVGWPMDFQVPSAAGRYRLEMTAERQSYALSSRIEAAWTFRSGHSGGTEPVVLPLWTVRFSPALDDHNAAPAGRAFAVPVRLLAQPGAAVGRVRDLTVEVSYDDGLTWTRAPLVQQAGGLVAMLKHPAGAGYVSLRAKATDTAGNSVRQTVIHAYRLDDRG